MKEPSLPGFRVEGRLGEGGMGAVYRAFDERLGRRVAVKVLSERLKADRAFVERFEREARLQARVAHPNLVTIYDASDGFLVMEYVEGTTLDRHLASRGRLPWEEARRLLDGVLSAVAALHAAGLVDRDLKPANVLMDAEGRPKVMDFGLAKGASEAALTQDGMILGTPEYMSPEQAKGDVVGPATDVYALGALAYEMLSGRPPFRGAGTAAVLRMQCEARPEALLPLAPGLGPDAAAWVHRALVKAPSARFRDAGEMLRALPPAASRDDARTTVITGPTAPRRRFPWAWAAAGLLGLLALLLFLRPGMPGASIETGGRKVEGRLEAIEPLPGGGHRVRIRFGGKEESVDLPPGQEGRLILK